MKQLDTGSVARVDTAAAAGRPEGTLHLDDLRIRPYGICDGERLRRMSDRLSGQSLYRRFFSGTPGIPDLYARRLHRMDHWDHEALVALYDDEIVGIAEYVRERADPRCAELAVLITDPWQRHGLARRLVALLVPVAARRGITGFGADVLPGNTGAISAVRSGWPSAHPDRTDGYARYELPLPLPPPVRAGAGRRRPVAAGAWPATHRDPPTMGP